MKKDEYKPSLKVNAILSFIVQLITYLTPLVCSPYLSRVLGAENIGIYSFAYSYAHYFLLFAAFGFTDFGARLVSKNRDNLEKRNSIFWTILFVRLLFVVVALGIYFVLAFSGLFQGVYDKNVLFSLALIIVSAAFDISFFFRGIEKFKFISFATAIANVLYVVSIFTLVRSTNDLVIYTLLKSGSTLLISLIMWIFCKNRISKPSIQKEHLLSTLKGGAAFFLPSLVMGISASLDQTFIGLFSNNVQVAYYQQSLKITTLLFSVVYAFSPVVLSRISLLRNDSEKNKDEINVLIAKSILLVFALLIPAVVGLYLIGKQFIPLYYGREFYDAVPVFYVLLPIALASSLSSIIINTLYYPVKQTWRVTIIIGISVIINVSLSILLLLTTNLGAIAAAIGTVIGEVIIVTFLTIFARKEINFKIISKDLLKIVIATIVMSALIVAFLFLNDKFFKLNSLVLTIINISIGLITYPLMCILLKEMFAVTVINIIKNKYFNKRSKQNG